MLNKAVTGTRLNNIPVTPPSLVYNALLTFFRNIFIMITYGIITTGMHGRGKSITWFNFKNFSSDPEIYSPKFLLPTTVDTYCRLFLDCSQNKIGMEMVSPDKYVVISGCLICSNSYRIDVGKQTNIL